MKNRFQRRAGAAYVREQSQRYERGQLVLIPRAEWPDGVPYHPDRQSVFRDRDFLVQLFIDGERRVRLSINRTESGTGKRGWADGISWDDLQRIKDQCGFAGHCAVELFPPADKVVNVANMRHLWILKEPPAFMWGARAQS